MRNAIPAPRLIPSGEGRSITIPTHGLEVTIKLSTEESNGAVSVWESHRDKGDTRGPTVHAHPSFDEIFYVLEGEYELTVAGERLVATRGTMVFVPRGTFHSFAATGRSESKMLHIATPGGFEHFYEELEELGEPGPDSRRYLIREDDA